MINVFTINAVEILPDMVVVDCDNAKGTVGQQSTVDIKELTLLPDTIVLPEGVGRIDVIVLAHEGEEAHRSCSVGRCKRFCGISKLILSAISVQSSVSVSSLRLMLSANDVRSPLLIHGVNTMLGVF